MGLAPTSIIPSSPIASTHPKPITTSAEIAEVFKTVNGVDFSMKTTSAQGNQVREGEILEEVKYDRPLDNKVDKVVSMDDKTVEVCTAEWALTSKSQPFVCSHLKPVSPKNRHKEKRFTFDVAKSDRIFDYLLENKQIKLSQGHIIPPLEELKRRGYCKWHNSYSHATNDCYIFRKQIQSAIDEGRLKFVSKPMDEQSFPIKAIKLQEKKTPKEKEDIKTSLKTSMLGEKDNKPEDQKIGKRKVEQWPRRSSSPSKRRRRQSKEDLRQYSSHSWSYPWYGPWNFNGTWIMP